MDRKSREDQLLEQIRATILDNDKKETKSEEDQLLERIRAGEFDPKPEPSPATPKPEKDEKPYLDTTTLTQGIKQGITKAGQGIKSADEAMQSLIKAGMVGATFKPEERAEAMQREGVSPDALDNKLTKLGYTGGDIARNLSQFAWAGQLLGPLGALAGKVPGASQVVGKLPSAAKAAGTNIARGLTKKGVVEPLMSGEKPTARDLAAEGVYWGTMGGVGEGLRYAMPEIPTLIGRPVKTGLSAFAGSLAAAPITEEKETFGGMALNAGITALFDFAGLALSPSERAIAEGERKNALINKKVLKPLTKFSKNMNKELNKIEKGENVIENLAKTRNEATGYISHLASKNKWSPEFEQYARNVVNNSINGAIINYINYNQQVANRPSITEQKAGPLIKTMPKPFKMPVIPKSTIQDFLPAARQPLAVPQVVPETPTLPVKVQTPSVPLEKPLGKELEVDREEKTIDADKKQEIDKHFAATEPQSIEKPQETLEQAPESGDEQSLSDPPKKGVEAEVELPEGEISKQDTSHDEITISKDDLPFDFLRTAHTWRTFDPESRARQIQKDYVQHLESIKDNLSNLVTNDEQKDIFLEEFKRFKDGYLKRYTAYVDAGSRVANPMITGSGNFNWRRNDKAKDVEMKRWKELQEWEENALRAVRRKINNAKTAEQLSDEQYTKLKNNALSTIEMLVGIKTGKERGYNPALFRSSLRDRIRRAVKNGYVEEAKKTLELIKEKQEETGVTVFAKRNSIWDILETPSEELEPVKKTGEKIVAEYEGARIVTNYDDDRVRIINDEKPAQEVINALKKEGWRWSPSNKAWQRKATVNAEASAKRIVGKYFSQKEKGPEEKVVENEKQEKEKIEKAETPQAKPISTGKTSTVKTERGTSVETQYAIVSAKDLISSHDTDLNKDPRFPSELQPRERERIASEDQITRIVNNLEPEFLGDSPKASDGAPIIGEDLIVESGNGRVIALKRVYENNHDNANKYKNWLIDNAERFGVSKDQISKADEPVLVRIRKSDIDRIQFVKEANEQSVAAMSATEQARSDAERMTGGLLSKFIPTEDGEIINPQNMDFIRSFFGHIVSPAERGRYITSDGSISQDGVNRIRNAVFAKAYDDIHALEKLAESTDSNVKNITSAMLIEAPNIVKIKEEINKGNLHPLDISNELVEAVNKISFLRERREPVKTYLQQYGLFGQDISPIAAEILKVFDDHSRSRKKIATFLNIYNEAIIGAGDPKQAGLFAKAKPTKEELLLATLNKMEDDFIGQTSLFQDKTVRGEGVREDAGRKGPEEAENKSPEEKEISTLRLSQKGGKIGIVAGGGIPDLFRPINEVSMKDGSLLSYEKKLLPPKLRQALNNIDKQASVINQKINTLFNKHNVDSPADLPKKDRELYDKYRDSLDRLDENRELLRKDVNKSLEGKVESGILRRIEHETKDDIVKITVEKAESDLKKAEDIPEGEVVGYMWRSPVEGKELFIPELPPPTNALEAMLSSQPGLYEAVLGTMRDVFGEQVVRPWRNAAKQYEIFVSEYERILNGVFKPFARNRKARERITLMLEGELEMKGAEGVAARQLRKLFYGDAPGKALFKQFEIDPDRFIKEYSPRVREFGDIEKAFPQGIPNELKFFAEKQREGELNPRDTDALSIAVAYLRAGAKKKFFDPVIEHVKPYVDSMHPDRRLIYEQFQNSVLGRPVLEERLVDGMIKAIINPLLRPFGKELKGRPARTVSAFIADLTYGSTVAFNMFSATKNLTQQLLTVGHLSDNKNPVAGIKWWAKAKQARHTKTGQELLKYCWVAQHRVYLEGLDLQYRFMEKMLGPMREGGYFLFQQADMNNVTTSFLAGTLKALSYGKPLNEAVEYGNATAANTQYLYGIDSPLLYKGPVGRIIGIFTSWAVNFFRLIYEQASKESSLKAIYTLMALIGGNYIISKATGLSFKSILPQEVAKGHPLARDQKPMPIDTAMKGLKVIETQIERNDPKLMDDAVKEFKRSLKGYIPGGVQLRRIEKFIDAAHNDWKVLDKQGRTLYEMSKGEAVRSLIGPTIESEERRKEQQKQKRKKYKDKQIKQQMGEALKKRDTKKYYELRKKLIKLQ